jgi:paraquat-inducible protein A
MSPVTAASRGLSACHGCGLLTHTGHHHATHCPRCGAGVHARKPDSIARTWAFLIAAMIMYSPTN